MRACVRACVRVCVFPTATPLKSEQKLCSRNRSEEFRPKRWKMSCFLAFVCSFSPFLKNLKTHFAGVVRCWFLFLSFYFVFFSFCSCLFLFSASFCLVCLFSVVC